MDLSENRSWNSGRISDENRHPYNRSHRGSTVVYAHMQAIGMVNDHLVECLRYREVATAIVWPEG
jgi:3-methyladenine DNA glycosylase Tag